MIFDILLGLLLYATQRRTIWIPIISMALVTVFIEFGKRLIFPALLVNSNLSLQDKAFLEPLFPLIRKLNFPTHKIFVVPGMANAGVAGIGRYALMLVGTGLVTTFGFLESDLIAVIGHELGHWVLKHSLYHSIQDSILNTCVILLAIYFMRNKAFYKAFDIETNPQLPIGIGLILTTGFIQISTFFSQPLSNYLSQMYEYQADAFSIGLGYGKEMIAMIPKLHVRGTSLAEPLYGLFTSTHPVYSSRVRAIVEKVLTSQR